MHYRPVLSIIAGCILTANVLAADLMQTYMEALANDPQYASARAALMAGQEKSVQGLSRLLPNLSASGGYGRNYMEGLDYSENKYTIALTQPIFNWADFQNYANSKLEVSISEAQFAQAQQDLMVRVAQAYFDVLAAEDVLTFAQAQKTAVGQQLELAKRSFEVGTVTITDTHEAQARYNLAEADEIAAINDLEVKRTALEQIIGHPPGILDPLKKDVKLNAPEPNVMSSWVSSAEQQNYQVIQYRLSHEMARRNIEISKAGHYPTVDLVASYNHTNRDQYIIDSGGTIRDYNTSKMVGIQWNIPLFSGFEVTSKVKESVALEDKARNDLEASRRSAAQQARQSYLSVNSGLSQVRALEAAEVASLSSLESNKLGYEVGVRINIDVLNAEQQVFMTRRDLTQARNNTIVQGLRLKQAAGILNEDDLKRVNLLLKK